jgi:hypothetical protein
MIGTLRESSIHATLKLIYKEPGDKIEKSVDRYVIDIVRDNLLIEIQTKNFSTIRKKLQNLIQNYKVLLIHPIIQDKWIINLDSIRKNILRKRLSPQHGSFLSIFSELLYISDLISNPNLIIEVILIQAEEIRVNDGLGSWKRKGWSIHDRKLLRILDHKIFSSPKQFLDFIPDKLKIPFSNQNLANTLKIPIKLARKMTYSLRKMNLLKVDGKVGKAYLFNLNF